MFTGIIQAIGTLARSEPRGGDLRLHIDCDTLDLAGVARGDSIAVSGACLTAIELGAHRFAADVSRETLACTTLGALRVGDAVNLEKALRVGDALGGHLVAGHIDGVGHVLEVREDARSQRWRFAAPAELARYIASKGSVCIDGVSLTVNEVDGASFGVNLIPHTVAMTTFGQRRPGAAVNLEVDLLARYVERMLGARA
ncbi:riboflavin synthase [Metallibacterium sp.]|uniref:riboflavin synthase n=1 Tax=Metallibacterium sp. TaxID=2940281 RepID=UPI002637E774|nr:riboflavin synthase [Metallibacterium sp.]